MARFEPEYRVWQATLASFGSAASGKHVIKSSVVLQGTTNGSTWTTLAGDQYRVVGRAGDIYSNLVDADGVAVDWSGYTEYQEAGNQAFRVSYTISTNGVPATPFVNEPLTFYEIVLDFPGVEFLPLVDNDDVAAEAITSSKLATDIQSDNYSAGVSGWKIYRNTGSAEFNDVIIRGTLYANAGQITGTLTIVSGGKLVAGNAGGARVEISDVGIKQYNSTPTQTAQLLNDGSGWLGTSNRLAWTTGGTVTAGGFTINASTITASNLTLDSSAAKFTLGSGNNVIILDAQDATYRLAIGSTTYASAPLRATKTGDLFADNVTIAGTFKAAVIQKSAVFAFAGSQLITKSASTLDSAATATGTTFDISVKAQGGAAPFAGGAGNYIRITDGVNTTWGTIGSPSGSGPYTYTVTYASGSNSATYAAGATVLDYGQQNQGVVYATADDADGPFVSIRTWITEPSSASNWTERVRVGNLRNSFGVGSNNRYGIAAGDYLNKNYMLYNPTDGFNVVAGAGKITLDADGIGVGEEIQLDDSGIWIGGRGTYRKQAGTTANNSSVGTVAWSNVGSAVVEDGQYAQAAVTSTNHTSNYLVMTGFSLNIPTGATIAGVKVDVKWKHDLAAGGGQLNARLVKAGSVTGNTFWEAHGSNTALIEDHLGDSKSTWGVTLTEADVEASNFGVAFWVSGGDNITPDTYSIDAVWLSVYYTLSGATGKRRGSLNGNFVDGIVSLIDRSISDVAVTGTTETSIYSKTVGAEHLLSTGGFRYTLRGTWINNTGSNRTLTLRFKFGSTTVSSPSYALPTGGTTGSFKVDLYMFNTNVSSQIWMIEGDFIRSAVSIDNSITTTATSSENTELARLFEVTAQWSAGSATITKKFGILEYLT